MRLLILALGFAVTLAPIPAARAQVDAARAAIEAGR